MSISLFSPHYDQREKDVVARILETGWSGLGPETEAFEREFSSHVGMSFGIGMNSCTSALMIALKAFDVGPGDEVIVPALTFVSSAHAIVHCGAKPVFCDINKDDLMISWLSAKQKITDKTKVIIAVNYGGGIPKDAKNFFQGLPVIWDCAHAAGACIEYPPHSTCCWSFHSVKNISCGDGGMITTDSKSMQEAAHRLRWMGIDKSTFVRIDNTDQSSVGRYNWEYECDEIGFKGHLNDLAAAIGRVQLKKLKVMQTIRSMRAHVYLKKLAVLGDDVLALPDIPKKHGLHLFVVRTDKRNELIDFLKLNGIQAGVHYKPVHLFRCYYTKERSLPVVEEEWKRIISLPLHPRMSNEDAEFVSEKILDFFKK